MRVGPERHPGYHAGTIHPVGATFPVLDAGSHRRRAAVSVTPATARFGQPPGSRIRRSA